MCSNIYFVLKIERDFQTKIPSVKFCKLFIKYLMTLLHVFKYIFCGKKNKFFCGKKIKVYLNSKFAKIFFLYILEKKIKRMCRHSVICKNVLTIVSGFPCLPYVAAAPRSNFLPVDRDRTIFSVCVVCVLSTEVYSSSSLKSNLSDFSSSYLLYLLSVSSL